jgi:hypothetical protein
MTARHYAALARLITAVGQGDAPNQAAMDFPGGVRARMAAGRRLELTLRVPAASPAQ